CRRLRHQPSNPPAATMIPGSPAPAAGPGTAEMGANETIATLPAEPLGTLVNPTTGPFGPTDSNPKVQQDTAGDALSLPKSMKSYVVTTPLLTTNEFLIGKPTYSPIPNPGVLLVTRTLVAAEVALFCRPETMPVTVVEPNVKVKSKLKAAALVTK